MVNYIIYKICNKKVVGGFMQSRNWYQSRLENYFIEYYSHHSFEYKKIYSNIPYQYIFEIVDLGVGVILTCDNSGNISEREYDPSN